MATGDRGDPHWRAYPMLILTTLCWGCNAVFGRMAVGEVSPMALVCLRWLGVVLVIALVARSHIARDWPVLREHRLFLFAMGGLGFTAFNALFYVAAHSTTAVNIGIIQGSMPMFVLIGAFLVFRTRFTRLQIIGVIVTMIGVLIIGLGGDPSRLTTLAVNHGDLLLIIACVFYSGYAVGLMRKPAAVSSLGLFTAIAAAAFLASLPLLAVEAALGSLQWPTTKGWVIVILVTLLPSLIAQVCFIRGVELIGPGRAGVFINLVPVFASILAVSFLNEPFQAFQAVALCLVLGGILISEWGKAA